MKSSFNTRNGSIIKENGEELFLEHRLRDFFSVLYDNLNEVVTRDELMSQVWKDMVVSEESVTKAASDLRKFFMTNELTEFNLKTYSKRGYKLEILEIENTAISGPSTINRLTKILGYTVLVIFLFIIIIRAIRYE